MGGVNGTGDLLLPLLGADFKRQQANMDLLRGADLLMCPHAPVGERTVGSGFVAGK